MQMAEISYRLSDLKENASRFVVLSGCSGGGKSTLLSALERRGFTVFEEPGRQIVKEQELIAGDALPWTNPMQFVELCVSRAMHQMASAARLGERVYFDRGIVDAVSFLEHLKLPLPTHLKNAVDRLRYHRAVFVVPPWPEIFTTDAERRHGFEEALAHYGTLLRTYTGLGYEVIELPKIDVETRADFILDQLARTGEGSREGTVRE